MILRFNVTFEDTAPVIDLLFGVGLHDTTRMRGSGHVQKAEIQESHYIWGKWQGNSYIGIERHCVKGEKCLLPSIDRVILPEDLYQLVSSTMTYACTHVHTSLENMHAHILEGYHWPFTAPAHLSNCPYIKWCAAAPCGSSVVKQIHNWC